MLSAIPRYISFGYEFFYYEIKIWSEFFLISKFAFLTPFTWNVWVKSSTFFSHTARKPNQFLTWLQDMNFDRKCRKIVPMNRWKWTKRKPEGCIDNGSKGSDPKREKEFRHDPNFFKCQFWSIVWWF